MPHREARGVAPSGSQVRERALSPQPATDTLPSSAHPSSIQHFNGALEYSISSRESDTEIGRTVSGVWYPILIKISEIEGIDSELEFELVLPYPKVARERCVDIR